MPLPVHLQFGNERRKPGKLTHGPFGNKRPRWLVHRWSLTSTPRTTLAPELPPAVTAIQLARAATAVRAAVCRDSIVAQLPVLVVAAAEDVTTFGQEGRVQCARGDRAEAGFLWVVVCAGPREVDPRRSSALVKPLGLLECVHLHACTHTELSIDVGAVGERPPLRCEHEAVRTTGADLHRALSHVPCATPGIATVRNRHACGERVVVLVVRWVQPSASVPACSRGRLAMER
eukprot:180209-Prymnesium_polylepis.1